MVTALRRPVSGTRVRMGRPVRWSTWLAAGTAGAGVADAGETGAGQQVRSQPVRARPAGQQARGGADAGTANAASTSRRVIRPSGRCRSAR
ncbi:hypothetical protein BBK82_41905 [Lentzea guizhouensis]|uniref:Uncharacterized protein n=1 Tax=Lentzea guizhouensis TaxID=1586287 RepID=A0A1B2HV10_9PSEU|nr:hypothetical protein BBK82_41905 [Lentzea guizhouensis]